MVITLTKAQRRALHAVYLRDPTVARSYREFRRRVQPMIGADCIMIEFHGMWLGIEPDGYTHS